MELSLDSKVMVAQDAVSCDLMDEVALLNVKDGIYYGLNPVGASVWSLIQKPRKVSDILNILLDEYDVDAETCQKDLLELLNLLMEKELVKIEWWF